MLKVDHVCIVQDESVNVAEIKSTVTSCDANQYDDKMMTAPSLVGLEVFQYDGVLDTGIFLDMLQNKVAKYILKETGDSDWPSSGVCCYVDMKKSFIALTAPYLSKVAVGILTWK